MPSPSHASKTPPAPLSRTSDAFSMELPQENMVSTIGRLVRSTLTTNKWLLTCSGVEIDTDEVAEPSGLLPILIWQAGQTLEEIWGPQPLVFKPDPASWAHVALITDSGHPILPLSVWLHAVHYEIEKIVLRPHAIDTLGAGFRLVPRADGKLEVFPSSPGEFVPVPNAEPSAGGLTRSSDGRLMGHMDHWLNRWNEALYASRIRIASPEPSPTAPSGGAAR